MSDMNEKELLNPNELPDEIDPEDLPDDAFVVMDNLDLSMHAQSHMTDEELRDLHTFTLVDEEGNDHRYLAMANLMVMDHQYLVMQPLDDAYVEGYYEIFPYEVSQDEDQVIEFRDFYDEEEYELAIQAAEDMFSDDGVEEEATEEDLKNL